MPFRGNQFDRKCELHSDAYCVTSFPVPRPAHRTTTGWCRCAVARDPGACGLIITAVALTRGLHSAIVHVVVRLVASVPGQLTADAQFASISWCWCWSQVGRRDQHQWQHQRGQQRFVVFEVSTIRLQAGRRESGVCPVCGVSRRCTTSVCSITLKLWKDDYHSG